MKQQAERGTSRRKCRVCGAIYEGRTATSDEQEGGVPPDCIVHPAGLCPEHEQLHLNGMIFIVEAALPSGDGGMLLWSPVLADLDLTGRVLALPSDLVQETIKFPPELKPSCLYVSKTLFDRFSQQRGSTQ